MPTLRPPVLPRHRAATLLAVAISGASALGLSAPLALAYDHPATEIRQDATLSEAAQAGILKLTAKGGFSGDVMAVDVDGARLPGKPVSIDLRIEFHGQQKDGQPWPQAKADQIAAATEGRLGTLKGSDGTPVSVDVIPIVRPESQPPTPGTHQIELRDIPPGSEPNYINGTILPGDVRTGMFGTNEPAGRWAHETLHILGFHDRYLALQPEVVIDGKAYPLPKFKGDKTNQEQLDAWGERVDAAQKAIEARVGKKGTYRSGVPKGHENDLLADPLNPGATLPPVDVDQLVARAGVHLQSRPGDVLLSKDGERQNLGVGASLDLFAPRGGKAHADGIWAYCLDLKRHSPGKDVGYDVLGQAGSVGGPQMAALQAVLTRIGADPQANAYFGPDGAQSAVWSITDGDDPTPNPAAAALVASAGVTWTADAFSASPHFDNANAASPATAAVTSNAVLPAAPVDRSVPAGPIDAALAGVKPAPLGLSAPPTVRLRKAGTTLRISLLLDGNQDAVTVSLRRITKGKPKRGKTKPAPVVIGTKVAPLGRSVLPYALPKLRAGKYRLIVVGASGWNRARAIELVKRAKRR